ncbi:MAG: cobyrinate a,c-diamide synthase [Bacillota bacterium]|nr:cobyrinate a,c-diamide synthase [Bacillota bacterium]
MVSSVRKSLVLLAGTGSGCGKTTVTAALLGALTRRGMKVQPFKCGPDYLDPLYHTRVTGRISRNLDSFLLDEPTLKYLYARAVLDADIAVVEGVMGYYDGLGGVSLVGSSFDVAQRLGAPAILVVNCAGMSLSVAAIVKGFSEFVTDSRLKGVILNKVPEKLYQMIKPHIEEQTGLKVLGYMPKMKTGFESRHLGLVNAGEVEDFEIKVSQLVDVAEKTLDIDGILELSDEAASLSYTSPEILKYQARLPFKLGIARDPAFCFYYEDNLELLRQFGASLIDFSPLSDEKIPDGSDGLYFGGGYPELYAELLSKNTTLRDSIQCAHERRVPIWAECGGFMYLLREFSTEAKSYPMVGLIDGSSQMTARLTRFGYIELCSRTDNLMATRGMKIKAHEFHYSDSTSNGDAFTASKAARPEETWSSIHAGNHIFAGYPHMHLWSNLDFAERFVNSCIDYARRRQGGLKGCEG